MQAVCYGVNPVGWATCRLLRRVWPGCLTSPLNGLRLRELPTPALPSDRWVRVRTLMAGICGSDLSLIAQKQPPDSLLQAFCALPSPLGHESLAVVEAVGPAVEKSWIGRRVCVEPTLCCEVRGIDPPCPRCQAGQFGACQNFAADGLGDVALPPATSIGYNWKTGGAFAEQFVAHVHQLVPVPDELPDELAVLTDPAACSLHAMLRLDLGDVRTVLVYGSGVLGLAAIASLRALGYPGRIDALDVHDYLDAHARALGADEVVRLPAGTAARFEDIARRTGGTVQRARFGNYMLSGGYDVVLDCVGTRRSIDESLRWTRSRGQMVLLATGHGRGADLTPVWFTELTVLGSYGRQIERLNGRRIGTYALVHEMMVSGKLDVRRLLTHTFRLSEYRRAFTVGLNKAEHEAVKVTFDFR